MNNSNTVDKQGKTKRPVPPQFAEHTFDKHPENINRHGRPKKIDYLRELIQDVAEEIINLPPKERRRLGIKSPAISRIKRMIYDQSVSADFHKQELFETYGWGKVTDKAFDTSVDRATFYMPADVLAPSFFNIYRDVVQRKHTEYVCYGGRGSTKSSFISLIIIYLIVTDPQLNAVVMRQVGETLRSSVYTQLKWAIDILGLSNVFNCTVSPLEIEYMPTGQRIYFRGADNPGKIKSIKTEGGYIGILWLEELDQFKGAEAVRMIEQSVIRGGDKAYIFKSFNPPRTANNWANKYIKIPKDTQYQHVSTYLDVPIEWLGSPFIEEAKNLSIINPIAYKHEYLGEVTGAGSMVFDNLEIRKIKDSEIEEFDRITQGIDWGFYPDTYAWVKMHYDAARLTLYIFDEYRVLKASNKQTYDYLVEYKSVTASDEMIADSADPKSIADYRSYGLSCRAAIKGPGSVEYSFKWLQSLKAIVIDNTRCPDTAEEFLAYEFERDKNDDVISGFPDKNDHSISAVRYGTSRIWKVRGQ